MCMLCVQLDYHGEIFNNLVFDWSMQRTEAAIDDQREEILHKLFLQGSIVEKFLY